MGHSDISAIEIYAYIVDVKDLSLISPVDLP